MDRRERRQKRRGEIIREFYDKGISTKIIPGMKSIRLHSERRDRHNWNDVSAVIKEALENDNGVPVVEKCLIYAAFKDIIPNDKLNDLVFDHIKLFKDPIFMLGCHDRHIVGLPQTLPFTCFEIPLSYKEELLFREVNFCVMLDLNSLSRIMEENGFHCRVLKDSDTGVLEVTDIENQSLDLQLLVMV